MTGPLVSIITPTYNHEHYVTQCIESVLAQSYENWEMIIIDDGSSDKTWEIVSSYSNKDFRVKVFRQENRGIWNLSDTYNFAVDKANGKYIAILEGDDFWPKNKLYDQVAIHNQHKGLIFSHGRVAIYNNEFIIGEYCQPKIVGKTSTINYLRLLLLSESCIMPVSVMVEKKVLEEIGGFHQSFDFPAVDFTTWIKMFQISGYIMYIDKVLGYWRQSDQQVTKQLQIEIANGCFHNAIREFRCLSIDLRDKLKLSEEVIIKARYKNSLMPAYLSGARIALINKDKIKSRSYAKALVMHGNIKRKLQGIFVYLFSYLGWNIEAILSTYEKLFI